MAIVNQLSKQKLSIPHEQGQYIEVVKLSWRQMELAKDIQMEALSKALKKMGGGDMFGKMDKTSDRQAAEPKLQYDRGFILEAAIVGWSYEEEVKKDNIDQLDEQTAAWAFDSIMEMNLQPRTASETKKG